MAARQSALTDFTEKSRSGSLLNGPGWRSSAETGSTIKGSGGARSASRLIPSAKVLRRNPSLEERIVIKRPGVAFFCRDRLNYKGLRRSKERITADSVRESPPEKPFIG